MKGTEVDELKAIHLGLNEVAASVCPDFIPVYFVRFLRRLSSLSKAQLCLLIVEISMSVMLFFPISDMCYPAGV